MKEKRRNGNTLKRYIWDTGALTLFFANHAQAGKIMSAIKNNEAKGYIPRIILSEYYYKTWQKFGKQAAYIRTNNLRNSKNIECTIEKDDIYNIGEYKVKSSILSLADCVLLNTAKNNNCIIITTETEITKNYYLKSIKLRF